MHISYLCRMDFTEILHSRYGLSTEAVEQLMQYAERVEFGKKECVVAEGSRDHYAWFVESGSVRGYIMCEDRHMILRLAFEGDAATWILGDTGAQTAHSTIETMETSVLLRIPRCRMEELFASSAELANWSRRMTEGMFRYMYEYITNYSWLDKGQQYMYLLNKYPKLIQRVPLKDLAAYLFVTLQTLSRIRAELKSKLSQG